MFLLLLLVLLNHLAEVFSQRVADGGHLNVLGRQALRIVRCPTDEGRVKDLTDATGYRGGQLVSWLL